MTQLLSQLMDDKSQRVVLWCSVLMVMVVIGFGAIMMFRRYLRQSEEPPSADPGFSLSELRAMRDRGEITPEEYEHTRARVIAKVKSSLDKKPKKSRPGPDHESASSSSTPSEEDSTSDFDSSPDTSPDSPSDDS